MVGTRGKRPAGDFSFLKKITDYPVASAFPFCIFDLKKY